ncbi:MAG: DUF2330 domain-containing protein, partial [Candidatus Eisenbacteria bacterium]|nr:DUF2330 domain-containing protein [Candidatus Eisenbacteria bacterium]
QSVSGFIATILSSTSAEALSTWLDDNGYAFTIDDAEKFAPYIEKEWVFTAMKPDPNSPMEMPRGGWDSNVDPVVFTYQATDFEVPLPLLSIRRSFELPMAFFVIDRERADLEGFMTAYSNQISSSELKAIRDLYPTFGGLLETGTTVTRLDKVFGPEDAMDKTIKLRQASSEEEFRRVTGALNSFPGALILLTLVVGTGQRALNHFFSKEGEQNG